MNSSSIKAMKLTGAIPALALVGPLTVVLSAAAPALGAASSVMPPTAHPNGKSYAEWTAVWWQWALELPVADPPHPFFDDPGFECDEGQSGPVWFLAGVFGTVERSCTIPSGKKVLFPLVNVECSNLEPPPFFGETEEEQAACAASFLVDFDVDSLFCTIDGVEAQNIGAFRFLSPQFGFSAPTPWIFGETGGEGTAVSDGYWLMTRPFSEGEHTVQFGWVGNLEMTYHLTVVDSEPVSNDGVVNIADLIQVMQDLGPCKGCPEDVNEDGTVDVSDLLTVVFNLGLGS